MCGIVGGVFRYSLPPSGVTEAFRAATDALSHRGPDDQGLVVVDEVHAVLGFRRLSIIDLASGHQPMATATGQHIVFNGEIYNYREIRRDLEAQGLRFSTASDTEVLLRGLAREGIGSLAPLRGMWDFAFLDVPGRRLVLARDRLGVKQLYYACTDVAVFFASEPKALLALPWVRREFARERLADYLTFRAVPAPGTLFDGINKLPPGTALELDLETWKSQLHQYWSLPLPEGGPTVPLTQAVSQAEQALLEAVRRRLVSDVPVGALLSGGLDSSMVVAGMSRLGHSDIRTFSAVFPGSPDDEGRFSRRVARRFGTEHHERPTQAADFLACLPEWVDLNDDLVADASSLPLLLVSRLARANGCKVLLSGEGADELFGGYGSYHKYLMLHRAARALPSAAIRKLIMSWLAAAGLVKGQDQPRVDEYFTRARAYLGTAALWGPEDLRLLASDSIGYQPPRARGNSLGALGAFDFERRIPDDLLVRTDRATMGASVEARVPFLDQDFVEVVHRLPRMARAALGFSKIALRAIARRWGVPYQTIYHRKIGFQIPLAQWFRTSLRPFWERVLRERQVPGLDYGRVSELFMTHVGGRSDLEEMLWRIGALELWYRRWILDMAADELPGVSVKDLMNTPGPAVVADT